MTPGVSGAKRAVRDALAAGIVMSWVWPAPSDHDENRCVVFPITCCVVAEIDTVEPAIAGRVKGAVPSTPSMETAAPLGVESSVMSAVRGSRRRSDVSVAPPEPVTVSLMSRCAG